MVVTETSDYFLVLDNRRGTEPVKTTATISAAKGVARPPAPAPGTGGKLNETRRGGDRGRYFFASPPAPPPTVASILSVPKRFSYSFTTLDSSRLMRLAA